MVKLQKETGDSEMVQRIEIPIPPGYRVLSRDEEETLYRDTMRNAPVSIESAGTIENGIATVARAIDTLIAWCEEREGSH